MKWTVLQYICSLGWFDLAVCLSDLKQCILGGQQNLFIREKSVMLLTARKKVKKKAGPVAQSASHVEPAQSHNTLDWRGE